MYQGAASRVTLRLDLGPEIIAVLPSTDAEAYPLGARASVLLWPGPALTIHK
jgi:hypothetical protein